jgi:hypothetical protein
LKIMKVFKRCTSCETHCSKSNIMVSDNGVEGLGEEGEVAGEEAGRAGPPDPLHCTALHCTALHCTALHCTAGVYSRLSSRLVPTSRSKLYCPGQLGGQGRPASGLETGVGPPSKCSISVANFDRC